MQRKYWLPSLLVLAVASAPALAEEIVYFTNGTSMLVQSSSIEDGTIRLDLGDQAYVAFSVEQIDRIETTEGKVRNLDSIRANKIVGSGPTGSVPARHRRQWQGRNSVDMQSTGEAAIETHNGVAVRRPYANSAARNKRQFTEVVRGDRAPTSRATGNGVLGTTRVGSRFSLPSPGSEQRRSPVGLSLALKPGNQDQDQDKDKNDEKK